MRRFAPGLVDAGASSAATFAAGVFAVRFLDLGELGAYALVFSGMMLATQIASQVVLIPTEARLVDVERPDRLSYLAASLGAALPWSVLAAALTAGAGFLVPNSVSGRWALAVTGGAAAFVSPLQDHVRRMLHLSGSHGRAALASMIRAGVVAVALVVGASTGIGVVFIPLGALALADLVSMSVPFAAGLGRGSRLPFRLGDAARSGSWLLVGSLAAPAAGFLVSLVVTRLAGAEELGLAEAARVAAQPMLVLAMGLAAVLGPDAMEAARDMDRRRARRATFSLAGTVLVALVGYLAATMLPEPLNPIRWVMPRAFELDGLAQLSIVAAALNSLVFLQRSELVVLDRTKGLASAEVTAGTVRSAVSIAAGALGAWVVPLGFLAGGLVRIGLFTWLVERDTDRPVGRGR